MFHRKLLAAAALTAMSLSAQALTTGGIAFTAFNADEDSWAIVVLDDIAANTTIYFNDNEWSGSAWNTGEHGLSWNTGSAVLTAGTVVTFAEIDNSNPTPDVISASVGTLALASAAGSNLGLSKDGDTLYAYLGSSVTTNSPTFLTAVTSEASTTNVTNAGLTIGVNAIALGANADFGEYTGARSGQATYAAYRAQVNNIANWEKYGSGEFTGRVLNDTDFTVTTAVPEPASFAMLLAGLGAVGLVARRRIGR